MGIEEIPLSIFALACDERWGADRAARFLKLIGYGTYSRGEVLEYWNRLRSQGINLERYRRLLRAKLMRAARRAERRAVAEEIRIQRLMVASLNMMN